MCVCRRLAVPSSRPDCAPPHRRFCPLSGWYWPPASARTSRQKRRLPAPAAPPTSSPSWLERRQIAARLWGECCKISNKLDLFHTSGGGYLMKRRQPMNIVSTGRQSSAGRVNEARLCDLEARRQLMGLPRCILWTGVNKRIGLRRLTRTLTPRVCSGGRPCVQVCVCVCVSVRPRLLTPRGWTGAILQVRRVHVCYSPAGSTAEH